MRRVPVVAAIPPIALLAVDPSGFAPFGPFRWAALTVVVPVALALVLRSPAVLPRRPLVAWAVLLAALGAATALAIDPSSALVGTPERHLGLVAWVLAGAAFLTGLALSPRDRRLVLTVTVAGGGACGAWATAEALGWRPLALAGAGSRPVGPLGSSAFLGAAACLVLPAAVGVAADRGLSRGARMASSVAAVLLLVGLVASGARAAWLGALVSAVVVLAVRPGARRRSMAAAGAGLAVAVVLVVATGVGERVTGVADGQGGVVGRVDEWRVAARVVLERPVLGLGPEGYRTAFGRHVDRAYEQDHGRDPLPDRAHAAVLDVAASAGFLGLAAWVVTLGTAGGLVVRSLRRSRPLVAGAAAGVLGYALQQQVLFPLGDLDVLVWVLAGTVAADGLAAARHDGREHAAAPGSGLLVQPRRTRSALLGTLAVVALVAGVLDVAADRRTRRVLDAVAADRASDVTGARRLRPDVVRYRLVAARGEEAVGTPSALRRAVAEARAARRLSPTDPVARSEEARLLLVLGELTGDRVDLERAAAALRSIVRRDPYDAAAHLRLGVASLRLGDLEAAAASWRVAEDLAPRSAAASTDLATAYLAAGRREEARAAAERALARDPASPEARAVLAATAPRP
jgi:O-antigen ligase